MKKRIIILGAGISGLSLGWHLKRLFKEEISLKILEKSSRPGGWIKTHLDGDFLFEGGPRSLRSGLSGIATLEMIEALGLNEEVIVSSKESKNRYIYSQGRLNKVPTNPISFLFSPLTRSLLPALCAEWRVPASEKGDETIYDFISRRLNSQIAENLIDPLTSGIYGGDIHQLSMQSCFPSIYQFEKEYGSIIKGIFKNRFLKHPAKPLSPFVKKMFGCPIYSFRNGMESLVKALVSDLRENIHIECCANELEVRSDEILVKTEKEQTFYADKLFIAMPFHAAAELLKPFKKNLESFMSAMSASSIAVVNMGWKANVLKRQGFGYLVPSKENERTLGVVWDSSTFPQQNRGPQETRLTAMLGGTHHPEVAFMKNDEIVSNALKAVSIHLEITQDPDNIRVNLAHQAIPQYALGHKEKVDQLEVHLNTTFAGKIKLIGNSWYGVGVNDCILHSSQIASQE